MNQGLSDIVLLRAGIAIAALILLAVIVYSSRRKPSQGKRVGKSGDRQAPTLRELLETEADQNPLANESTLTSSVPGVRDASSPMLGARVENNHDKIVSVLLVARAGQTLAGPDLVVAAEKAGLIYGHMNIFHRMVDNHPESGPIFSVASLIQPGDFDLRNIKELRTPGITFFITLPGPLPALDAWDALLPTAQRMSELLDAIILDEERNALSRQRIANIRDELRAYDRAREKLTIKLGK